MKRARCPTCGDPRVEVLLDWDEELQAEVAEVGQWPSCDGE